MRIYYRFSAVVRIAIGALLIGFALGVLLGVGGLPAITGAPADRPSDSRSVSSVPAR